MEACVDAVASIEEYIAALPEEQRAALEELRRTIRAVAPGATEAISYQIPSFRDRDRGSSPTPRSRTIAACSS